MVDPDRLHHRNRVTPYAGTDLCGVVRRTWLRGREVGDDPIAQVPFQPVDEHAGTLRHEPAGHREAVIGPWPEGLRLLAALATRARRAAQPVGGGRAAGPGDPCRDPDRQGRAEPCRPAQGRGPVRGPARALQRARARGRPAAPDRELPPARRAPDRGFRARHAQGHAGGLRTHGDHRQHHGNRQQVLQHSNDSQLAAIAEKSLKETKYHLKHSSEWVIRLGDGTEESHSRVQDSLNTLWRYTTELFFEDEVEQSLIAQNTIPIMDGIKKEWTKTVHEVLQMATLEIPQNGWEQIGGRQGKHSEHLGYILAELQYMQRAYPNMKW